MNIQPSHLLQGLRVPRNWHIEFNAFLEVDSPRESMDSSSHSQLFCVREQLGGNALEVKYVLETELSYTYVVNFYRTTGNKRNSPELPNLQDQLIESFSSKSRLEIVERMEYLMRTSKFGESQFPHKLQALRIPSGWHISSNMFFEIDPTEENIDWFYSGSLFCATNNCCKRTIDLEYQPEDDPTGEFILSFLEITGWTQASRRKRRPEYQIIEEFSSRSRIEIVEKIEQFMNRA
jgi:hypothetical protein